MKKHLISSLFNLLILTLLSHPVTAQKIDMNSDTLRKGAVKIFLDCQSCDMNYTRQQITFVNFVRDVKEAEVYILISEQNAGSGGSQFTFGFQGIGKFNGINDTLVYTSNPDETTTIVREKKTNMLQMGLMKYVARTQVFSEIEFRHNIALDQEDVIDKWNNWVFSISTSPEFLSEESNKQLILSNKLSAIKVTPDIKLEIQIDQSYSRRRVIDKSGEETTYVTNEFESDNLFVKSLSDHWSAGFIWDSKSSTVENYDLRSDLLPSIEYDLFPYSEATYRQLRFLYSVGIQYNNYIDSTIFSKIKENLFKQEFNIAFAIQQKWGSINLSLAGSNYLNDFSKNKVELNTVVNLRVFKGLSLEISGSIAHIRDQINLKIGDISDADRLLKLKEISTVYRIEGMIGLTYTFGSIYNNVVNPRFGFGKGVTNSQEKKTK
jgi:hypothetical protein